MPHVRVGVVVCRLIGATFRAHEGRGPSLLSASAQPPAVNVFTRAAAATRAVHGIDLNTFEESESIHICMYTIFHLFLAAACPLREATPAAAYGRPMTPCKSRAFGIGKAYDPRTASSAKFCNLI